MNNENKTEYLQSKSEDLQLMMQKVGETAGLVKLICGVCNNAAHLLALDAMDEIRRYPGAKKRTKGGYSIWYEFKRVLFAFNKYERKLLYAEENRFFHLADMAPETRKRYGDISDRDYFEMWETMGGYIYTQRKDFATCLQNKWRLYLERKGIKGADVKAWALTALNGFGIASVGYNTAMDQAHEQLPLLKSSVLQSIFGSFSISHLGQMWMSAMDSLDHEALMLGQEALDPNFGNKNIKVSVEQLQDVWLGEKSISDAMRRAINGYSDVFRTQGEMKKSLKEVDEFEEELANN